MLPATEVFNLIEDLILYPPHDIATSDSYYDRMTILLDTLKDKVVIVRNIFIQIPFDVMMCHIIPKIPLVSWLAFRLTSHANLNNWDFAKFQDQLYMDYVQTFKQTEFKCYYVSRTKAVIKGCVLNKKRRLYENYETTFQKRPKLLL